MKLTRIAAVAVTTVALSAGGALVATPAHADVQGPFSYSTCMEKRAALLRNPSIRDANCYQEPPRAGWFLYYSWR